MTENEFNKAIKGLNLKKTTLEICFLVLVKHEQQNLVAERFNICKSAVNQKIKRVMDNYKKKALPKGYRQVTLLLSDFQYTIAKKWDRENNINLFIGTNKE